MTNSPAPVTQAESAETAPPKRRNWFRRHKILTTIGALVLVAGFASAANGGSDTAPDAAPDSQTTQAPSAEANGDATVTDDAAAAAEPSAPADPADGMTVAQANAFRSAQNYLSFTGFSRQGLIDQLSSEHGDKFAVEDATVAVDALGANWEEQAGRSAANYLSLTGFSRQGLIDQLSSEHGDKFTVEQATAAVDAQGADWNEQARRVAENYLSLTGFSRQGLIDQLSSKHGDKFTVEQATAGVTAAGL